MRSCRTRPPTRSAGSASQSASRLSTSGCGRSARPSRRRWGSGGPPVRSSRRTAATASPSLPCGGTRATSSRPRAGPFSPTASSPAPLSSAATRSATRPRSTTSSPSCAASSALAAGGSRSSAPPKSTSTATARSASSRCRSATRRCCGRREFSLEGRAIRKVRQSVSRLGKAGYRFRIVAADEVAPQLEAELEDVSAEWRGGEPERGFAMAIDDLHVAGTRARARRATPDGRVGGFLHLAPSPAGGGWSLSTMRRRPDAPNGLTEFLVVETVAWARETGASELSLNFCALTDFLCAGAHDDAAAPARSPRPPARRQRLPARAALRLQPQVLPRVAAAATSASSASPTCRAVGLAYLHAESLLVPPGPWTRRREARAASPPDTPLTSAKAA